VRPGPGCRDPIIVGRCLSEQSALACHERLVSRGGGGGGVRGGALICCCAGLLAVAGGFRSGPSMHPCSSVSEAWVCGKRDQFEMAMVPPRPLGPKLTVARVFALIRVVDRGQWGLWAVVQGARAGSEVIPDHGHARPRGFRLGSVWCHRVIGQGGG